MNTANTKNQHDTEIERKQNPSNDTQFGGDAASNSKATATITVDANGTASGGVTGSSSLAQYVCVSEGTQPQKTPDVFYQPRKGFLIPGQGGEWVQVNERGVYRELVRRGYSPEEPESGGLSDVEAEIGRIQREQNIHYAGPLAGYPVGYREVNSLRVLVTAAPKLIEPKKGGWDLVQTLVVGLLGDSDEPSQIVHFLGWLKMSAELLRSGIKTGRYYPGQVLVLAGPIGIGKSLLQHLISKCLGGRAAKAYSWMTDQTMHNAELFGAEHLIIEDEVPATDIRSRRVFGASIKKIAANHLQRIRAMYTDGINVPVFWRATVSVNNEPEFLQTLPPLDESITDKLILLRCHEFAWPMPMDTEEEKAAFVAALEAELPAFLDHLLNEFEIPAEIRSPRYGVRAFLHPTLVQSLDELSPETRLLELIDVELFSMACESWTGTAAELQAKLTSSDARTSHEARRLFSYAGSVGHYLGRLRQKHPSRIKYKTVNGIGCWTLFPSSLSQS